MKRCVFAAVAVAFLSAAAAATISSSEISTSPNTVPFRSTSATDYERHNHAGHQKLIIVPVAHFHSNTIQTALAATNPRRPFWAACSHAERALFKPSPIRSAPGNQVQFKQSDTSTGAYQPINSVIIGKHRNSSDKSRPWFLDGPGGDAAHERAEGKARGGTNPYVPQQQRPDHHDAFIRFISDDLTARGRFIHSTKL